MEELLNSVSIIFEAVSKIVSYEVFSVEGSSITLKLTVPAFLSIIGIFKLNPEFAILLNLPKRSITTAVFCLTIKNS